MNLEDTDDEDGRLLDAVAAGDAAFSPRAARQLTEWVQDARTMDARQDALTKLDQLTDRERPTSSQVLLAHNARSTRGVGRRLLAADFDNAMSLPRVGEPSSSAMIACRSISSGSVQAGRSKIREHDPGQRETPRLETHARQKRLLRS